MTTMLEIDSPIPTQLVLACARSSSSGFESSRDVRRQQEKRDGHRLPGSELSLIG
jgi:hypothetical protein